MSVDCSSALYVDVAWAARRLHRKCWLSTEKSNAIDSKFGGIAALGLIFAVLFVPELKGRSLEETDELFEQRLWAWQFKDAQTTGVGRRIAKLQAGIASQDEQIAVLTPNGDEDASEKV
jgi:hypothetical protein